MITTRAAATLLGLLLLTSACGSWLPGSRTAQACAGASASSAGATFAAASRTFGMALTRQLVQGGAANVFTSPLSAELALAMAATGARGDTQRAMLDTLGLTGLDSAGTARDAAAVTSQVTAAGCGGVEIANGMWAGRGITLDPGFVRTVRDQFGGETAPLDVHAINDWVSGRTHGRIPSVLTSLPPMTILELVDATYFHGDWQAAFDASKTRPAPFHRASGADVSVPLMDRTGHYDYGAGPGYQAVALPYEGGGVRMVVVLPATPLATVAFAPYLDAARFDAIVAGLRDVKAEVQLPRFGLDVRSSLVKPLAALGMGAAFQPSNDFAGVSPACEQQQCYISDVAQRARLQVDEQGTTAAAGTAVGVSAMAGLIGEVPMVVDRPFLVAIQDVSSGALLFDGVVGDPTA